MQVQLLEQEPPLWPEQLSKELFSLREGVCDGRSEARLPTSPEMRAQYGNEACTCSMSLLCASSRCERCGASWRECRCVARVKNIASARVRALKFSQAPRAHDTQRRPDDCQYMAAAGSASQESNRESAAWHSHSRPRRKSTAAADSAVGQRHIVAVRMYALAARPLQAARG